MARCRGLGRRDRVAVAVYAYDWAHHRTLPHPVSPSLSNSRET